MLRQKSSLQIVPCNITFVPFDWRFLSEPACSSQLNLHLASPQLLWTKQQFCGPFSLETIFTPFEKLLNLFTRSLDHCILFRFIFFRLSYILRPIFTLFTHFTIHHCRFSYIRAHAEYFFFIPDTAVDRRKLGIHFFYISDVYSFDTMKFHQS